MEQRFDEIEQAALSLPIGDRSRLVVRLEESLTGVERKTDNEDAWVRLAIRRLEEVRSGRVEPLDGPASLKAMRDRVRG